MKFCTSCGANNEDSAVFCASCGNKFAEQETPQAQAQPVYQAAPSYEANPAPANKGTEEKNPATLWLILHIALTVLCCCTNVVNIVGIVFAAIAMNKYKQGDVAGGDSNLKIAKILLYVGVGLGVLSGILGFVGGFFTTFLAALGM